MADVKRFIVVAATILTLAALVAVSAPKTGLGSLATKGLGALAHGLSAVGLVTTAHAAEGPLGGGVPPPASGPSALASGSVTIAAFQVDLLANILTIVPVEITCNPGTHPSVSVLVEQAVGTSIAWGMGTLTAAPIECDGTPRLNAVFVLASFGGFGGSGGVPFFDGFAIGQATLRPPPCFFFPCAPDVPSPPQLIQLVSVPLVF